jgi:hypothetical protein
MTGRRRRRANWEGLRRPGRETPSPSPDLEAAKINQNFEGCTSNERNIVKLKWLPYIKFETILTMFHVCNYFSLMTTLSLDVSATRYWSNADAYASLLFFFFYDLYFSFYFVAFKVQKDEL